MIYKNKEIYFVNNHFSYISSEFYEKMKSVNLISKLINKFEEIILGNSNLIKIIYCGIRKIITIFQNCSTVTV